MLGFRSWAFEVSVLLRYCAIVARPFDIGLGRSGNDRIAGQRHIPGQNGDLFRNKIWPFEMNWASTTGFCFNDLKNSDITPTAIPLLFE